MRRRGLWVSTLGVLCALGLSSAAHAATNEDSVTGVVTLTHNINYTFDVQSGPLGENPRGTVVSGRLPFLDTFSTFRVTCLNVTGNRATIGIHRTQPSLFTELLYVEDNGTGVDRDKLHSEILADTSVPTACPVNTIDYAPLRFAGVEVGDLVVHDAQPPSSKEQCKNRGWQTYGDATFKNQGQCVAYVERGPK